MSEPVVKATVTLVPLGSPRRETLALARTVRRWPRRRVEYDYEPFGPPMQRYEVHTEITVDGERAPGRPELGHGWPVVSYASVDEARRSAERLAADLRAEALAQLRLVPGTITVTSGEDT